MLSFKLLDEINLFGMYFALRAGALKICRCPCEQMMSHKLEVDSK